VPFPVIWHNRRRSPFALLSPAINASKRGEANCSGCFTKTVNECFCMDTDAQLALWNGIAPTARETKERRLSGTHVPISPISASFIPARRIFGAAAKGMKNAFHCRQFARVMTPAHRCCNRLQVFCPPTGGGDASAQSSKHQSTPHARAEQT
jgi:hypothetical protein